MTDLVLSASQAETYDPEQPGGCPRRWWLERVERRERPDSASADDGHAGHALIAGYLRGRALPKRARMLKAVKGALHHLPAPQAGMLVESRFDGQASHGIDGIRIPLNGLRTLWLGGVPWDGYVDLRWRDGDTAVVWDHKFSSDPDMYARPADKLIRTVQMPVYALDSLRIWPDAQRFRLVHLYVSRRGVYSFVREQTVAREEIEARGREIAALVARIQRTAAAKSQEEVEANRKACHAYGGCPHQSVCTAFRRKPVYELTEEEKALFGPIAEVTGEKITRQDHDQTDDARAAASNSDAISQIPADAGEALPADVRIPLPQASTPIPQAEHGAPGAFTNPLVQNSAGVAVPMCQDCPHAAHLGSQCSGKRGRGQCRCGAQGTTEKEQDAPALKLGHLPTCVQADGGKWICMEGCAARKSETPFVSAVRDDKNAPLTRLTIPDAVAERLDRALSPEPRTALRLEIEFGPRAAAILEKLAPALVELLKGR